MIDSRELLAKFAEREELGCTVIDDSKVAMPHCRFTECLAPIGALLRFKPDVPFGNSGTVALAFALVVPLETNDTHLEILKTIALVCSETQQLNELLDASSPRTLRDTFLCYARQTQ